MMTGGMEQTIIEQGPNWTDIVSCIAAILAIVVPLVLVFLRHRKNKR